MDSRVVLWMDIGFCTGSDCVMAPTRVLMSSNGPEQLPISFSGIFEVSDTTAMAGVRDHDIGSHWSFFLRE